MERSPSSSGSFTPPSDGDLPVRIGAYRVMRRLATGGTSDVLLARAEGPRGFERPVVLKLLLQEFRDDETFERMFAREAAAYARLSHPAIVKLYDFFSDAGQLVMVLEYVDGLPLHKLRALLKGRGSALDDRASMWVASRIFGALSAAHAARDPQTGEFAPVIHRDVNPSNVLIPWDGHAKIADFGIAKVAGVEMDKTQAGFIKGTYGYMAPEQVRGGELTVRTDVYAACLLLWELLAGRKAIVRGSLTDLEVLRAMAEPAFPQLAALRPDLPRPLLDAIGRGLEPDPDRRTVQAEDLVNVLRAATNLEEGRQRLVDALAVVRPPASNEDLATTQSRPSASQPPPEVSPDATIPNPVTLRGISPTPEEHEAAADERGRVPAPPASRPAAPAFGGTLRMANVIPPRPVPSVATTTLKGLSSTPPVAATPPPAPAAPPPRAAPTPPAPARPPAAPPPPAVHPPPQTTTLALPPPKTDPLPKVPPAPPPPAAAAEPSPRPPSVRPPPPPAAAAAALSPPAYTPPPVVAPPVAPPPFPHLPPPVPPNPSPTPAPAPVVAWAPEPPARSPAPERRGRGAALALALVGVGACAALVLVLWARGRATVYTPPPRDKPLATVAATTAAATATATATATEATTATATATATPTGSATASAAPARSAAAAASSSAPAPSGTTGTITVSPARGGHRVWVDKQIVGESPGTFTVRCGWHSVQVGSQGQRRDVEVPCGGDVEAR